ncbi:MAG: UDP-N-acetylmuramoyl-L-alanine--D-glutamate ligase [Elusimicrobia bacterium]|nr:UDP-N-acetylmuramoyl-L-alanine--D-glutamate ligase [Elusimicrobiota bacterium]
MFIPEKFRYKTACVLGLGASGVACANLLRDRGFEVLVSDSGKGAAPARAARSLRKGIAFETGGHSAKVLQAGFIVKSPGIDPRIAIFRLAARKGIPVFSEVETALALGRAPRVWAVTGTNGKTTTTALLAAVAREAGLRCHAAGNIGPPVSSAAAAARPGDLMVLEVSSYQLEDSSAFAPEVSVHLNITPDHMDHHGSMRSYMAAKLKASRAQTRSDVCVYNADDARLKRLLRSVRAKKLGFSLADRRQEAFFDGSRIRFRLGRKVLAAAPPALLGKHNIQNAMAAGLGDLSHGIALAAVQRAFRKFKGIAHRLESVAVKSARTFINDSKATNVDSTQVALRALEPLNQNILLILGGLHKGVPYRGLLPLLRKRVRLIFAIGKAAPLIRRELGPAVRRAGTLRRAVQWSYRLSRPGEIILLSPACASFDQFRNFEHRGEAFKALVRGL